MKRRRNTIISVLVIASLLLLVVGLWYRQGRNLYALEPYPRDMPQVSYQVFSGGESRSLEVNGGLAGNRIFDAVESLTFHRAASNLITQPLGLWRQPELNPPEGSYAFILTFEGITGLPVLRLCFSGGQWYYQNAEMEGYLPCSAQPNGIQAGEELGKLLWEMTPTWEAYGYN